MPIDDFIITIFCLIDDELEKMLQGKKLRQGGRVPNLTDSEVITMEIVGEFLGKDRRLAHASLQVCSCQF
jgi:hypothetical protein